MSKTEENILAGDVYAMLNRRKVEEQAKESEKAKKNPESIEDTREKERELLRIKGNLFEPKSNLSSSI